MFFVRVLQICRADGAASRKMPDNGRKVCGCSAIRRRVCAVVFQGGKDSRAEVAEVAEVAEKSQKQAGIVTRRTQR